MCQSGLYARDYDLGMAECYLMKKQWEASEEKKRVGEEANECRFQRDKH